MASRKKPRQRISYVLPLANSPGGHRLGINSLAFDSDNSTLYSGGRDGMICAWNIDTSTIQKQQSRFSRQIHAHTHWVNDIVLADHNRALVSASSDITVKIWRPGSEDGNTVKDIGRHKDYVKVLASPGQNEDWVVSGGLDHTVKIWDLNGAGEKFSMDTEEGASAKSGSVYSLSARQSIIASGGPDQMLRLWDPKSGKRITKFVGHTDNVRAILINESGNMVMTGSSDQTIKVWSITAGRCISTLTMHNESVWSLWSDHPQLSVFYSADRSGMIVKTDVSHSDNFDEGISIAVAHEHSSISKIIAGNGSIWSTTTSSSINRWQDIDLGAGLESPDTPSQVRVAGLVSRRSISVPQQQNGQKAIPLSCVLKISNAPPQSFRDYEESGNIRRMSEAPVDNDTEDDVSPYHNRPSETIEGQNGLIKHVLLNDRKRVLTLDSAGEVILWDLLRCVPIKSFGKKHLEDVRPEVDNGESIANWCTVTTKAGNLTVALEENYCFDAEVYADQDDIEANKDFREDGRINLGKWVLRYLFAGLIDEEIIRDADYRRQLEKSRPVGNGAKPTLSLGQLPPPRPNPFSTYAEDTESITTPKGNANGLPATTPGFSIGVASPGLSQVVSNGAAPVKTPGASEEKPRMSGDYFSNKPPPPAPNTKTIETTLETTLPTETPASPTEPDDKTKSPSGLFGKKFRLPLKKLGRTSVEATKPAVVEDKVEEQSDKASEKEEPLIEDNMFGVIQKVHLEYDHNLQHYPDEKLQSIITPSLPSETPVINPPGVTAILIQEDAPESGGLADLYRGTVASVGKDAEKIEKVAPMWLGDLLLRNQIPFKDIVKVSFILHSYDDLLPPIATEANARLNANRMLRAKKICSYITERIDPEAAEQSQAQAEPNKTQSLKPEDYLELYCNDQLIQPNMTLAMIRAHIWRTGGDVILYYKGNGRKPQLEEAWKLEKERRRAEEVERDERLSEDRRTTAAATGEAQGRMQAV